MLELAWIAGLSGEPSKKSRDAPQKVAAHLGSRAECGRGYHVAARFTENIRLFEVAFNALRQLEAYETIRNNTKQHPIAICGTIASIKPTSKDKAINLKKSKAIKRPDLPDILNDPYSQKITARPMESLRKMKSLPLECGPAVQIRMGALKSPLNTKQSQPEN